ncbi:stress activator protein [Trichoderma lentiforme]|uniref:Stress activator protein n=1 Tax=Trichoderma lentiforme TaxID=1567552 RepID=A0A9P4XL75_9HYPO|nr:stress activator protein [Trichoderma lentiforme]
MSSKDDSHATSSQSVQPVVPSPALSEQLNQTGCGSKDKYLFQPPITVDLPQMSREEHRVEWKRISCDFCRRRKVKCDKRDPCGQCSISFRGMANEFSSVVRQSKTDGLADCVYSERSKRAVKRPKNSSSQLDAMEKRLKMVESNQIYPSPAIDVTTIIPSPSLPPPSKSPLESSHTHPKNLIPKKTDSEEIGKCTTAHHFIEHGEIEFHGTSADRTFMEGLIEKLGDSSMTHQRIPVDGSVPGLFQGDARCLDEVPLPGRDHAVKLVEAAFDAQVLLHIVHRPSFDFSFNMIYSLEPREYSLKERRFLPLLYAVLAYGSLFVDPFAERLEYEEVITRASRYFIKSKQLQDIASCNDLVSMQAIVFKNLFLIYTTRTPFCYTYLCTSMSVALRMGLHRSLNNTQDLISREISKRVFWALKLLSSEVATCVGLPTLVNDEDLDQELPLELNDAYIYKGKTTVQPPNEVCYSSGLICYSRLHNILHKVLKDIYPRKGRASAEVCGSMNYTVRVDKIHEIEQELEKWATMIPLGYRLGTYYQGPAIQRISVSPCASACIQACHNIIELCEYMCRWGLLTEASWPAIRFLTSCMLTLLYITIMHQDSYEEDTLFKSLATGRKLLHIMEKRSFHLSIKYDHIREKLMKYEMDAPIVRQCDLSSVSGVSTALLGEKIFTLSSKTYLGNHGLKLQKQNGPQNDSALLPQSQGLNGELKGATSLQQRLFLDRTGQRSEQNLYIPTSEARNVLLKTEDSPIQRSSEPSSAPTSFVASVPTSTQGNSLVAEPTIELHQEQLNGSWMHALGSMNYSGNVYSPVKDLIGGTSPPMDDINEFSDIWDWF